MEKDLIAARASLIAELQVGLEDVDVEIAQRMADIRGRHCPSGRDDEIITRLRHMRKSMLSLNPVSNKKNRITFVTGESNAGKSTLVEYAIANDPFLSNIREKQGVKQLVRLDAPPASSLQNLGVEILRRAGYLVRDDIKQTRVWPKVREQLKNREVAFIIIDEAQRLLKIKDENELQAVSDSLISLVDMQEWPIRLVLIGVDPLPILRARDKQMETRSEAIDLRAIPYEKHQRVEQWMMEIISKHAGLEIGEIPMRDYARRLIHACDGNVGSIISLIRDAVELAIEGGSSSVTTRFFAQAYHKATKCGPDDNLFEINKWLSSPSGLAKIANEESVANLKPLPSGERPR